MPGAETPQLFTRAETLTYLPPRCPVCKERMRQHWVRRVGPTPPGHYIRGRLSCQTDQCPAPLARDPETDAAADLP